jgi:hypothetical protein
VAAAAPRRSCVLGLPLHRVAEDGDALKILLIPI